MSVVRAVSFDQALNFTLTHDVDAVGARSVLLDLMVSNELTLQTTELRPDGAFGGLLLNTKVKTGGIGGPGLLLGMNISGGQVRWAFTGAGSCSGRLVYGSEIIEPFGTILLDEGTVSIAAVSSGTLRADSGVGRIRKVWAMINATKSSAAQLRGGYGAQSLGAMAEASNTAAAGGGYFIGPVPCPQVFVGLTATNNDAVAAATFAWALVGEL